MPPMTAPAWVSFMTGKNPGAHGVLCFQTLDLSRYNYFANSTFVTSAYFADQSIFQLLSHTGHRVAAISVPMTYPPFPVNGILVSGFPHPGHRAYTYPPELAAQLEPWYLPRHRFRETNSPEERIAEARYHVSRQAKLALELLKEGSWDLFVIVFSNTDSIAHYFWRYMVQGDPESPYTGTVLKAYQQVDEAIGQMLDQVGPETLVMVMSDHGMRAAPERVVHLNGWLRAQGLLSSRSEDIALRQHALEQIKKWVGRPIKYAIQQRLPRRMVATLTAVSLNVSGIDWAHTQAYYVRLSRTVDGIQINLQGRQPLGIITPGAEYEALRDEIIDGLKAFRDPETDAPVVETVMRREEIFSGPRLAQMPDLIVQFQPDYAGGVGLGPILIERPRRIHAYSEGWSATHDPKGMLIMAGSPITKTGILTDARIEDLAPTILYVLGKPIPADMNGRVLVEALDPDFVARNPIRHSEVVMLTTKSSRLSKVEEEEIENRLRAMGYLD